MSGLHGPTQHYSTTDPHRGTGWCSSYYWQLAPTQLVPLGQTLPQEPQFLGSLLKSTQVEPQMHMDWQFPFTQCSRSALQTWLQEPQL